MNVENSFFAGDKINKKSQCSWPEKERKKIFFIEAFVVPEIKFDKMLR